MNHPNPIENLPRPTGVVLERIVSHLVQFSGGVGSWAAAKRVAAKYGTKGMALLFANVRMEDDDLYRFIIEAADNVGAPLIITSEGRTPWEVFFDEGMMGNTRADPCSRILKRELLWKWITANCDPSKCTIHYGIDWTEQERIDRQRLAHPGWNLEAPMCEPPLTSKDEMLDDLKREGIKPPRLYAMGFPHNNCGGFCVKAGQAHFANLLEKLPDRYRYHEEQEAKFRATTGKDVSILRDRRGGATKPLTLAEFRGRIQRQEEYDRHDIGGCGCALDG